MMLNRDKAAAVMIDMQEKLVPAMSGREHITESSKLLLDGLGVLKVPVIATQQYTRGLGETISELKEHISDARYIEKISFSAWREPEFVKAFRESGAEQAVVFGIETHVCVEQTVLDMLEAGVEVFLAADCVSSRFDLDSERALRRMEQAGAVITSFEAVLFELTERAGSDTFKAVSRIVKSRAF